MDMVRPVFQLEHLQKLIMNLNTPIRITTDGMHGLIRGLPHIHHLDLVGIHRSRKPVFSPSSLLILAREAPQLRYLAMEMTGNWKALRKELESFSSSSHLEVLNVGSSVLVMNEDDIEDEVFRALKGLFPLLQTLETNHKHTGWFCQIAGKAWGNISDRFDVKPTRVMSSRSCWYIGFQGEEAQDSD
ncbi:hypothetical protein FRC03_011105 [Tulasnella sp. 419]|nr:hypothetical protein FRC03_011105 [Tulasnella sp. 419]